MITDNEKANIKRVRDSFLESISLQIDGEDLSDEMKAEFVGANMAMLDGLFAIREGEAWRGITEPKEIARVLLRQGKIGE